MTAPLLEVEGLSVEFRQRGGVVRAVSDVGFTLHAGRTFAVVGESGSGKSVTSLAIMRLLPATTGRIAAGSVRLREGETVHDLVSLPEPAMRRIRGRLAAMIFQEPMTSLNPVLPVGEQIAEVLRLHMGQDEASAAREAVRLIDRVGIPSAAQRARGYPHELSGGMRQRVMIAMALACKPLLLIADEPTTALDVTIQAQVLTLIRELQDETGMAVLFITHNLGVVAEVADDVAVMYGGQFVETGRTAEVLRHPLHPYTRALLASLPPEIDSRAPPRQALRAIPGQVVSLVRPPSGCRFAERCDRRIDDCTRAAIALAGAGSGRAVRCIRAEHAS